jgi:hypothetical protein
VHEFALPMLTHPAERVRDGMQHEVFSCGGASVLLPSEKVHALLPYWGVSSDCSSISWFIQMDDTIDKVRVFQTDPDWEVLLKDSDSLIVMHKSGSTACFHDQPEIIWTCAGAMQTPHAVRIICPGPQRQSQVRKMLVSTRTHTRQGSQHLHHLASGAIVHQPPRRYSN